MKEGKDVLSVTGCDDGSAAAAPANAVSGDWW